MVSGMLVLAHRGANRLEPENTVPAMQEAIDRGADGVELDVHRTADGVLVVRHDAGTPVGLLGELTTADLGRRLPEVPTLAVVLDVCRGRLVNVEIKDPDPRAAEAVVDLVAARSSAWRHDRRARVVVRPRHDRPGPGTRTRPPDRVPVVRDRSGLRPDHRGRARAHRGAPRRVDAREHRRPRVCDPRPRPRAAGQRLDRERPRAAPSSSAPRASTRSSPTTPTSTFGERGDEAASGDDERQTSGSKATSSRSTSPR